MGPGDAEPDGDEQPGAVEEAAAVLAEHSGVPLADATRALHADADVLGLPVSEIARDVVDMALGAGRAGPAALAGLLAAIGPPPVDDRDRGDPAPP